MKIKKQNNLYAIAELTEEQIELIQIAAGALTEAQPKKTAQDRFLRGLAIAIDKQLPTPKTEDDETNSI